ncbi:MAG: hypothetical protein AAGD01_14445 [Acidobacteriota bacterium]
MNTHSEHKENTAQGSQGKPAAAGSRSPASTEVVYEGEYQYRVVEFVPKIDSKKDTTTAGQQLQYLIHKFSSTGWEFYSMEQMNTFHKGSPGCFGLGHVPDRTSSTQLIVFRKPAAIRL